MLKKYIPYIAVITAMLIWSVSGIAIKIGLESFLPMSLIVTRFTMAVLLMLIIGLSCRHSSLLALVPLERKDIPLFLLGGFFQPFLYYLLETYCYRSLDSPTVAEALLSTSPLLAPFFALALLRERVTLYNIVGIVVSSVGMLLLVLVGADHFSIGNPWGLLFGLLAVCAAVLYTIVLRRIPTRYNSLSIVFYIQICALCMFIPLWACTDLPTLCQAGVDVAWLSSWPFLRSLLSVGFLAVFASVTAFILFCYSVRCIGVTRTNAFNNVRPAFTAIFMLLLFAEQLPLGKWLGIVLIIVGLFVSNYSPRRPKK